MTPPKLTPDLALFLDFDGTLVDIAPTPDGVKVPYGLREALSAVHDRLDGALAVVSGRMLEDVGSYLKPLVLPGSGSHGVERRLGDGRVILPEPDIEQVAREIGDRLRAQWAGRDGVIVEEKHYSAALHYRGAPDLGPDCLRSMQEAIAGHRGWEVIEGKMVIEGRPEGISKADAVRAFMAEPPFAGRMPVFVGDDRTDEDGMRAAIELGGFGIKVGDGDSVAAYRLSSPQQVKAWLDGAL